MTVDRTLHDWISLRPPPLHGGLSVHTPPIRHTPTAWTHTTHQIWRNAIGLQLHGVCVTTPRRCAVVVEGGQKAIKKYKKLMLRRIQWSEGCSLVWEGPVQRPLFKKFECKTFVKGKQAKEYFAEYHADHLWKMARYPLFPVECLLRAFRCVRLNTGGERCCVLDHLLLLLCAGLCEGTSVQCRHLSRAVTRSLTTN